MEHRMANKPSEYKVIRQLTRKYNHLLHPKEVILTYQNRTGVVAYSNLVFMFILALLCSFLDTLFFLLGPRDSDGILLGLSSQGLFYFFMFIILELFLFGRFIYNYIDLKRFVLLVTNQRVIIKEAGNIFSFPFLEIMNVYVIPSWIGVVFGYGNLSIANPSGYTSVYYRIKNVNGTATIINKLVGLSVSKKSEREVQAVMSSKV